MNAENQITMTEAIARIGAKCAADMKAWQASRDSSDKEKLLAFVKAVRAIELPDLGTLTTKEGKDLAEALWEHLVWTEEKASAL